MKKQILLKSLLILFPVLAVGLATTADSVTVFDTVAGQLEYYSYFDMIPVENLQMLPPLAAMLSLVSGILSAVYLGKKSVGCLTGARYMAFAAVLAASIPVVIRGEVLVIPNVALPVLMLAQFAVTHFAAKLPVEVKSKRKGQRLQRR